MPRYRVLVKSYINNTIIDPETMSETDCIVEYDGVPGSNLELIGGKPAEAKEADEAPAAAAKPHKGFAKKAAKADAE